MKQNFNNSINEKFFINVVVLAMVMWWWWKRRWRLEWKLLCAKACIATEITIHFVNVFRHMIWRNAIGDCACIMTCNFWRRTTERINKPANQPPDDQPFCYSIDSFSVRRIHSSTDDFFWSLLKCVYGIGMWTKRNIATRYHLKRNMINYWHSVEIKLLIGFQALVSQHFRHRNNNWHVSATGGGCVRGWKAFQHLIQCLLRANMQNMSIVYIVACLPSREMCK